MKIDEAKDKCCPYSDNGLGNCIIGRCMAWQFDITNNLDIEATNELATEEEIRTGIYSYQIFKQSTTDGWCKLIDKDK